MRVPWGIGRAERAGVELAEACNPFGKDDWLDLPVEHLVAIILGEHLAHDLGAERGAVLVGERDLEPVDEWIERGIAVAGAVARAPPTVGRAGHRGAGKVRRLPLEVDPVPTYAREGKCRSILAVVVAGGWDL